VGYRASGVCSYLVLSCSTTPLRIAPGGESGHRTFRMKGLLRFGGAGHASARLEVLSNEDLIALILHHARLNPHEIVYAGRVCTIWRAACRADASLLMAAARSRPFLTKGLLVGLFGLSSAEANALPRTTCDRGGHGGFMHMYDERAIARALPVVGGLDGWKQRLARRAMEQALLEATLGPDWRRLQWCVRHRSRRRPAW
jgi:hypothetical protein